MWAQFLENWTYTKNGKKEEKLRTLQMNTVPCLHRNCRLCKDRMSLSKINIKMFILMVKITSQHSNKATNLIISEKLLAISKRALILQKWFDKTVQCESNIYLYIFYMNAFTYFGPLRPSSEDTMCQGNYSYIDHSTSNWFKVSLTCCAFWRRS
jgi:hypothetical protein